MKRDTVITVIFPGARTPTMVYGPYTWAEAEAREQSARDTWPNFEVTVIRLQEGICLEASG